MSCAHCELPISKGEGHPKRPDLHPFCYEVWKGELIDDLTDAINESGDYIEIQPGIYQHKDYVKP